MPLEEGRMQRFVVGLLDGAGALAEPVEPDLLEVLAPPPLQQALGIGESSCLAFGTAVPEGALRVGIESDWLARFSRVIGERGRWSRRILDAESRRAPDAERVLAQELCLDNATFRVVGSAPAWTRYLVMDFRFTALSDEKREGIHRLAINLATGAMPEGLADGIGTWSAGGGEGILPADAALPPDWEHAQVIGGWPAGRCHAGWRRHWRHS